MRVSEPEDDWLVASHDAVAGIRSRIRTALAGAPHRDELIAFVERGKMLRARIALAATRAAGGSADAAATAAVVLECLHSAALVQDDIVDGAPTRRSAQALHVRFGGGVALMLADYLVCEAFAILARDGVACSATIGPAVTALADCVQCCVRGQLAEAAAVTPFDDAAEEVYLAVVRDKTGSQFVAAATLGSTLSGCRDAHTAALAEYGWALGSAFQIRDDVLDLRGDAASMGKPVMNSLERGRLLLPLVYLARYGSRAARRTLRRYYDGTESWAAVRAALDAESVWTHVTACESRFLDAARKQLVRLPQNDGTRVLDAITRYASSRRA